MSATIEPATDKQNQAEAKTLSFFKRPLIKTILYGYVWALGFALLLPLGTINPWQYSFFIGAVPSTLIWDTFNIQNTVTIVLVALLNSLILFSPYFYYRLTQMQYWWFYLSISLYGFINAALGFTIIISVKGLAAH